MKPRVGRIPILDVAPVVDLGRWPAKAVVGETFTVSATIIREGHAELGGNVVLKGPRGRAAPWALMRPALGELDRYAADVTPDAEGKWTFWVEAWGDPIATWRHDARIKVPAGQDVELVLAEGAVLHERAAAQLPEGWERDAVLDAAMALRDESRPVEARLAAPLYPEVVAVLDGRPLRELVTKSDRFRLDVERERALYSAWYEMFPRSEGAKVDPEGVAPPQSGTFATAAERLDAIARMGFDVVYLPPIHPIGRTFRKGANNTLDPGPHDPGVPWAIGAAEGGHDAVHPDLGTIDDFDRFVKRAAELDLEVALDFALQASPDHPWVTEHPEWFTTRLDGTIAYAENPPKKYQDIYPLNFDNDYPGIYAEILRVLRHWISHGVRIFRVDNPHTKPLSFWEELIAEVRADEPDVIFLSEAFTRPQMMRALAKIGFQQSYTYFTWRTGRAELEEYFRELATETAHYLRPNFFVNTPDILHAYLQYGGPPAFKVRAVLASMASPSWGVYSGYELFEHVAVRPGSEEYLDSEKYAYRPRDWAAADRDRRTLAPYLARLNQIRREHPALHWLRNLRVHWTDDENIIAFTKSRILPGGRRDSVIVVVNLDTHAGRETMVHLDLTQLGMGPEDRFTVVDQITGASYGWGRSNYVRLIPFDEPAHVLVVQD
jgi:starch synthase (maltosyl-transferring)